MSGNEGRREVREGDCPVCADMIEAEKAGRLTRYRFDMSGDFLAEPGKHLDVLGDLMEELHGGVTSARAWEDDDA